MENANSGEDWKIKTYLVKESTALYPFVFLDYSTSKISGYCVSYILDTPSVAALSTKVVHTWQKEIYPNLDENKEYKFTNII
jgi:hypothetical protein